MLSGRRAFHGDTSVETLNAILKEEPPEFPAEPEDPAGAGPAGAPLPGEEAGGPLPVGPRPRLRAGGAERLVGDHGRRPFRPTPPVRRRWLIAGLAGVLALAALAGGFLAGRQTAPSNIPTYRQITFRRGLAPSGRFTPDGKTVVYSAAWDGGPPEIYSRPDGRARVEVPRASPGTRGCRVLEGRAGRCCSHGTIDCPLRSTGHAGARAPLWWHAPARGGGRASAPTGLPTARGSRSSALWTGRTKWSSRWDRSWRARRRRGGLPEVLAPR